MKVLRATTRLQGGRSNDFCYTKEGELVMFGFECDRDRGKPDGTCGCARSFVGLETALATTTAVVEDLPEMTEEKLAAALRDALVRSGWLKADEESGLPTEDAQELVRIANVFNIGDVVEKRGDEVRVRTGRSVNVEAR